MFSPQENDEDEEIGALGSILSWDDDEEGVGVGAAGTNSTLPDLVSFNLKDGGLTNSYLQQLPGVPLNQSVSESDASPSLNLPLPTPITFGQPQISLNDSKASSSVNQPIEEPKPETNSSSSHAQATAPINQAQQQIQQQEIQRQQIQQQQLHLIGVPATNQQPQQAQPQQPGMSATSAGPQGHQVNQQALTQQGAFALLQQNVNLAQNAYLAQNQSPMGIPNVAQPGQDQRSDQHAPAQFPFTDPGAFLRQLQVAQLQQQFNAVQQARPLTQIAGGPQAGQVPAALQQQLQFQAQMPMGLAPGQPGAAVQKEVAGRKKLSPTQTETSTQRKMDGSSNTRKAPVVSASDTDGELSSKLGSNASAKISKKGNGGGTITKTTEIDTSNMSAEEKAKANRDRNREHARNTRLRKKAYLEKLKTTVDELCRERDTLVSERAGAANILVEMHNTRTEVLMSFFALRSANEKRRELWSSILDESCFTCVLPVTPYRSFPASEVQVSKCQRTILGIDGMMADTASLHVLLNSLVDRSRFPNGTIVFRYTLVTEEAVIAGNQIMARWVMSTLNATQCGARMEVAKQGMLCCKFNSAHKIIGLELMFDVMALMLQLKQAAGSETFSVIPNTVQTCQRNFDKPMVMTLADEPYTIVQVNKLWEEMTGYQAEEVVGKTSIRILEGEETDPNAVEVLMNEIRFKRPASALIVNCKKTGERFRNFFLAYPLSTDSRITHYLHLSTHVDTTMGAKGSIQHVQQGMYAPKADTSGNILMPSVPLARPKSVQPTFFDGIQGLQASVSNGQIPAITQPSQQPVFGIPSGLSNSVPKSKQGTMLPPALTVSNNGTNQQYPASALNKRPHSGDSNEESSKKQAKIGDSTEKSASISSKNHPTK